MTLDMLYSGLSCFAAPEIASAIERDDAMKQDSGDDGRERMGSERKPPLTASQVAHSVAESTSRAERDPQRLQWTQVDQCRGRGVGQRDRRQSDQPERGFSTRTHPVKRKARKATI